MIRQKLTDNSVTYDEAFSTLVALAEPPRDDTGET